MTFTNAPINFMFREPGQRLRRIQDTILRFPLRLKEDLAEWLIADIDTRYGDPDLESEDVDVEEDDWGEEDVLVIL